jgi:excisionase family DNA binding protein
MKKLTDRPDAKYMTLQQTADLLNVSMLTCRKICAESGAIRNFGGRTIRIDRDALMGYINTECTRKEQA